MAVAGVIAVMVVLAVLAIRMGIGRRAVIGLCRIRCRAAHQRQRGSRQEHFPHHAALLCIWGAIKAVYPASRKHAEWFLNGIRRDYDTKANCPQKTTGESAILFRLPMDPVGAGIVSFLHPGAD